MYRGQEETEEEEEEERPAGDIVDTLPHSQIHTYVHTCTLKLPGRECDDTSLASIHVFVSQQSSLSSAFLSPSHNQITYRHTLYIPFHVFSCIYISLPPPPPSAPGVSLT